MADRGQLVGMAANGAGYVITMHDHF
jgi:hypothetical protein